MERMKARITVLKCMDNQRIQEEQRIGGHAGPCDAFEVGQTFDAGWQAPEGFCSFAWADIFNGLMMIQCGGSPDYIGPDHTMISCCRDGLCPVVFKIERLDQAC
ncbi:TIGR04076 family protein [Candidatus Bipolaricaulota bacterium]|nr:TIGR04076 family protein [Candidatus Bipolaricaulota bacterium]